MENTIPGARECIKMIQKEKNEVMKNALVWTEQSRAGNTNAHFY